MSGYHNKLNVNLYLQNVVTRLSSIALERFKSDLETTQFLLCRNLRIDERSEGKNLARDLWEAICDSGISVIAFPIDKYFVEMPLNSVFLRSNLANKLKKIELCDDFKNICPEQLLKLSKLISSFGVIEKFSSSFFLEMKYLASFNNLISANLDEVKFTMVAPEILWFASVHFEKLTTPNSLWIYAKVGRTSISARAIAAKLDVLNEIRSKDDMIVGWGEIKNGRDFCKMRKDRSDVFRILHSTWVG